VERAFGSVAHLRLPMLQLRYISEFENAFDGPVQLVMEPGSIGGTWSIRINESGPLSFSPTTAHVRGSFGVDVTAILRTGTNRVVVEIETDRVDGGLLNCLYLIGEFSVLKASGSNSPRRREDAKKKESETSCPPWCLGQAIRLGRFGRWEESGLPFYAGVVEYRGKVQVDAISAIVELPIDSELLGDDAVEVSFNAGPWHAMLWSPRLVCPASGELRIGANEIRLRVYTTLLRAFEGQHFDVASHRSVDVL
jgi:hypothetical protein